MTLIAGLETQERITFSAALRAGTAPDHRAAEQAGFVHDLLTGRLGVPSYATLAAQLFFVYSSLEEAASTLRTDTGVAPFLLPELDRVPALRKDLAFLLGPDWRERVTPLPATRAYVRRIRKVAATWPPGFVAHHYTRYLGDLSGGRAIARAVERHYGITAEAGASFYDFPAIPDANAFKADYRRALDGVSWDQAEQARVIEEACLAFRLNGRLFQELEQTGA